MAVLQKTRIKGLLTAEAGITLSGGVLTAPSGTINNLTSNNTTVNSTLRVGAGTTLTTSSITTSTANFTTIEADTYRNLPVASETLQGISYLTDNYLAGQTGRAVSAVAVYNFYQNITGQMGELEDRVIGVSSDAFNKNPPTLWSVKNYADQMSITGGDILDDVADNADMYVEKPTGSPTLNIHIKKFVAQTEFEVLNDIVEELTGGDTGIITDLGDRVSKLESALPISSFGSTTVYNYIATSINNRLGWGDNTTVQSKINDLNNSLSTSISDLEKDLSDQISNITNSLIPGLSSEIDTIRTISTGARDLAQSTSDNLMALEGILRIGHAKYEATKLSDANKTVDISLKELGISMQDAPYLTYIVTLNGFVLKGATSFPSTQTQTSATGAEYIFINGGSDTNSYIRTTNTLLANQEFMVYAFGYRYSEINGVSTASVNSIASIANTPEVKKAAKLLW